MRVHDIMVWALIVNLKTKNAFFAFERVINVTKPKKTEFISFPHPCQRKMYGIEFLAKCIYLQFFFVRLQMHFFFLQLSVTVFLPVDLK